MSVRITNRQEAVIYDSTTGIAFGPVFDDALEASDFVEWLPKVDFRERDGDLSDTARLGAGV